MSSAIKGIVHGRIIELDEAPGLPDGAEVVVFVRPRDTNSGERLPPGEGLRRSAGAWADDPEGLDAYLEWNRRQRKVGRAPLEP
ncbi:MAG: hypothetical protein AB7U73_04600 [Pirellulales bacterium]